MRLIDADAFIEEAQSRIDMQDLYLPIHIKENVIDAMPTIQVVDDCGEISKMCFQESIKAALDSQTAHECNLDKLEAFNQGKQFAYHQMAKWIEGYRLNREGKEEW